MKIFVNALSARLGGGQTYLLNLIKHLPQDEGFQVFLLVQPDFYINGLPRNVTRIERSFLRNPFLRALWEEVYLVRLLNKLEIDLFFSPGGLLPRFLPVGILTAVTFQNMLPFDHIQRMNYKLSYRWIRDFLLERELTRSMRRADLVVFISQFARNFISNRLGSLTGNFIVAPHGLDQSFIVNSNSLLDYSVSKEKEKYILYVSFIDYYKAQIEIVRGYKIYRERGGELKLFLVGAEYLPYGKLVRQEILNLGLQESVIMVGNVNHNDLPTWYQKAEVNIFASYTENCPNILLEIMASGRPALVSNYGPMPEFGRNAVEYFDPSSPVNFAKKLENLLNNQNLQRSLASKALKLVSQHNWKRTADLTWLAFKSIYKQKRNV